MTDFDPRTVSYIEIKELYTKDGKHVSSVAKTPDGREIWNEGPNARKDVGPFFRPVKNYPWGRA